MLEYNYKVMSIHDHRCDCCGIIYITMCTKEVCNPPDELCLDCFQEYQRYMERYR